jgi:ATP-binding cassette subfamily F protein uup
LAPTDPPAKRLSWTEQREWEGLEASILAAEEKLAGCQAAAHDPTLATDAAELAARWQDVEEARAVIDRLYARWAELDVKRG